MNQANLTTLTATLKGCPLAVFFVMLVIRRVTSPKELATLASYNEKTVREALHKLKHFGLVTTTGNEKWMLTDQGYQLPLGTENQLQPGPGVPKPEKKSQVLHRSSSNTIYMHESESHDLKTTTTDESGEKISGFVPNELSEPAISLLTDRWACPKSQATAVVTEALNLARLKDHNLEVAALALQWEILLWLAWYFSPHGKGITTMPAFIVAKIQNYELPPEWFVPEEQHELYQEILAIEKQISDKEQEHAN